jgi:hypothetical protein
MHYECDIVLPFITKTLPKEQWTHLAHLYTGLWHVLTYDFDEALCLMRSRIITYNEHVGGANTATSGYHETLTVFYLKHIAAFVDENQGKGLSFNGLCELLSQTDLANPKYPFRYYDAASLMSSAYRASYKMQ